MAARKSKKKSYYRPPTPEETLRRKLLGGIPIHMLLHYHHGKNKLDVDVREMIHAGVLMHEIDERIEELSDNGSMPDIEKWGEALGTFRAFRKTASDLLAQIRKALLLRMMEE